MITSVTAANKQPLIDTFTIDSVRGGGGRGGGGSSSSGTDIYDEFGEDEDIGEDPVESDQATTTAATKSTLSPTDAANIAALDPAVRDLLGNYWLNDPRLRFGTTDGMVHSEILDETLPVIREAAKATTVADATLVCGYKLTPVTLVGRMWNLPTQYTCIWRNYTCCSICGALMLAFEWNYITSWGYVCTRHTGLKPVEVNTGSGLYSSRLASTLPNRLSGGSAHDLQMQTRYFVSQTRQLNGIPQPWLEAYGYKNIYEAAGVAESSGLQDYGEENSDWSTSNDFCDCCVEESTASSSDRPVDYYTHVIYLIEINKTNGTVRHRRYCQRHYRTMCSKRKQ